MKKKGQTQLERHQALREEGIRVNASLGELDRALELICPVGVSGHSTPARKKLYAAADFINRVIAELRQPK